MKIIELTIENVKRLKAVQLTPNEHVQVVAGRNAQGKTSVLDAIWFALGGGAASRGTKKPVRDGETHASVQLDLGDMVVTRVWSGAGGSLRVESKDGAQFRSPQAILDGLVGRLAFDPLEFTRLPAKAQAAALLDLIDLPFDLDELATERERLFDARTDIGREARSLEAHTTELGVIDEDAPLDEVSGAGLVRQIEETISANQETYRANQTLHEVSARVEQLERDLAAAKDQLKHAQDYASGRDIIDTDALREQLSEVEVTNARVRANQRRAGAQQQAQEARQGYDNLTADIEKLDAKKAKALLAAKFPVDGLGFDADGVTYQGIPFGQASSAEQIRVSLAMAMALNPKLRVIRIDDGSLLDRDNLAMIEEMATANDYQVWIERVGDGDGIGVVIEDGEVKRSGEEVMT